MARSIEPALIRALVRSSAERLRPVLAPMQEGKSPLARNYRIKLVDGNHLAASDKRIKPLRGFRGAALPGHSLVVYDPEQDMVVDMVPCEDGHAQERSLTAPLLEQAQAGDLWIGDRNFSTRALLAGWHERGCGFIVREHGASPHPQACDAPVCKGRIATGAVYEQPVTIADEAEQLLALRRIELHLDCPTEDGERVMSIARRLPH